eukprot:m.6041 g.6041  ORF g.6041 m.6041 type:complete len:208 (+) comp5121_c0_seq2:151-774(+)
MSINLEKHKHPQQKREPAHKREFVDIRTGYDKVKWEIEKFMNDPNQKVKMVAPPKERGPPRVKEFNPNIHGSSAGAGSGEFHVYRADKRREMMRQQYMDAQREKEAQEEQFSAKMATLEAQDESKTAKKRAKRQKAKLRKLQARALEEEKQAKAKAKAELAAKAKAAQDKDTEEAEPKSKSAKASASDTNVKGEDAQKQGSDGDETA